MAKSLTTKNCNLKDHHLLMYDSILKHLMMEKPEQCKCLL